MPMMHLVQFLICIPRLRLIRLHGTILAPPITIQATTPPEIMTILRWAVRIGQVHRMTLPMVGLSISAIILAKLTLCRAILKRTHTLYGVSRIKYLCLKILRAMLDIREILPNGGIFYFQFVHLRNEYTQT